MLYIVATELYTVVCNDVFERRTTIYTQRKDLLQLMLDASDNDETQKGLKAGEIVADSVGFILAGYETTSTALTFATYLLATNTEAQERLANEIHEYFEENPVSDDIIQVHCCVVTMKGVS